MVAPLKVGIAGLGTVGAEVVRLIEAARPDLVGALRTRRARRRGHRALEGEEARARPARHRMGQKPAGAGQRSRHRLLRRIDGRLRRSRAVGDRGGAEIRQVGGHRQQGADRQARIAAGEGGRKAWRRAEFRGGGRRRHSRDQDPARGSCRHRHQSRLRHSQRHLQLHPDPDGAGGPVVRRMPEGRAASRLCRGQSVVRRRRPRHRAEARDSGQPRLRHQGGAERGLCRRHFLDRAGRSARRGRTRLPRQAARRRGADRKGHRAARASDHGAEIVLDRAGDGRHQCGDHRWRGHSADHAGRSGRRRCCDRVRRGRRHRRCRARHPRQAVRPSGRRNCARPPRRRWSATKAATISA